MRFAKQTTISDLSTFIQNYTQSEALQYEVIVQHTCQCDHYTGPFLYFVCFVLYSAYMT